MSDREKTAATAGEVRTHTWGEYFSIALTGVAIVTGMVSAVLVASGNEVAIMLLMAALVLFTAGIGGLAACANARARRPQQNIRDSRTGTAGH